MSQFSRQKEITRNDAGIHTTEGTVAGGRASMLARQREQQQQEYESKKRKIQEETQKDRVKGVEDKFTKHVIGASDTKFTQATYGLKTRDEFLKAKAELLDVEKEVSTRNSEKEALLSKKRALEQEKKKRKLGAALSFNESDSEDDIVPMPRKRKGKPKDTPKPLVVQKKVMKNPEVRTDFLPDKERDQREQERIEQLKQEWKEEQERIKEELVEVTYSYWDGSGHRRSVSLKKGCTIGKFLQRVHVDLVGEFPELRGISPSNLMYVKEDLIIPHTYSFYDLIVSKLYWYFMLPVVHVSANPLMSQARGKSGPLFKFDVHDDVRLVMDVRVEKDESHPGKVCERHWFERNKHIFPASRWEVYDPSIVRDKYTVAGDEVRGKR